MHQDIVASDLSKVICQPEHAQHSKVMADGNARVSLLDLSDGQAAEACAFRYQDLGITSALARQLDAITKLLQYALIPGENNGRSTFARLFTDHNSRQNI